MSTVFSMGFLTYDKYLVLVAARQNWCACRIAWCSSRTTAISRFVLHTGAIIYNFENVNV